MSKRIFNIVDGSARKRKPCAQLIFDSETDEFSIHILEGVLPNELPLILALLAERGEHEIGDAWSRRWIEERIVPPDRQNIGQVLKAHDLDGYDELALLVSGAGRCSQDDFYLYELVDWSNDKDSGSTVTASRDIGAQIAHARQGLGITQGELSARTGIQQAVISRFEQGKANPTIGMLEDIARGLGREVHIELREPKV